jgi:hypothetical protein
MSLRRVLTPWLALTALATFGAGARTSWAKEINNNEWNFQLDLPSDWSEENVRPSWEKEGIRASGLRRLEKLDNGNPAKGEGGRAQMCVIAAPKGKTLAELSAAPEHRGFLMNMFGKPEAWPAVESEEVKIQVADGSERMVPGLRLETKGKAINLAETDESPCKALMIVALADDRFYRLKMIAWTTPDDAEMLGSDLDALEMSFALRFLKKEKSAEPGPGGPGAGKPGADEPPKPVGDSEEEKMIDQFLAIEGWKVKKPKKLATMAIDKVKEPNLRVHLGNNDSLGACALTLHVYPNEGFDSQGLPVAAYDIRKVMTTDWWGQILAQFPLGALVTYPWPKARGGGAYLAHPNLSIPDPELLVIADDPKKRPKADIDIDAVLRLKPPFVEEVEKTTIGKVKLVEAYRGVIRGAAKTAGRMITLRYTWKTKPYTFMLFIRYEREGLKRYETPVKEFLASFEMHEKK